MPFGERSCIYCSGCPTEHPEQPRKLTLGFCNFGTNVFKLEMACIPKVKPTFICICDYENPALAAIILSYLSEPGFYLPLFEFPPVTSVKCEPTNDDEDENTLSRIRAEEFSVFVNNTIFKIGGCDNLILAGISKEQKSYLHFLANVNVIEITQSSEIEFLIGAFASSKNGVIKCRPDNILSGLHLALKSNALLRLDSYADEFEYQLMEKAGMIIVEDNECVSSVVAVNYAFSIGANIHVVSSASEEIEVIRDHIEEWQKGDEQQYEKIEKIIFERLGSVYFDGVTFATFFTDGVPYSLALKNKIPFSYVHLSQRPDFFVINGILHEQKNQFGGAVVFSPQYFNDDEETKSVSAGLRGQNYFVKDLLGEEAIIYNLDMCLKNFPYDIFHICSHGGEMTGYTVEEEFTDRDGNRHTVLYDQVLSFWPDPSTGLIAVQTKVFYKKFDGYIWKSRELNVQNYPQYVYADMSNAMRISKSIDKKRIGDRKVIANSCFIQCHDGAHQGMISFLAAHSSPFIFNNTCWSWYHIAELFLSSGIRGYIGTLWAVGNKDAVAFAEAFYSNLNKGTILEVFHSALDVIKKTPSEDIYILWGLHFSTFTLPANKDISRTTVLEELAISMDRWKSKLLHTERNAIAENIKGFIHWIRAELVKNFLIMHKGA